MDRTGLALRVDVLGRLALRVQGTPVQVPGSRRRALLALLALEGERGLSSERIIDSLWPDEPPEHAVQAVYTHISRLRGHLGPLATRLVRAASGGYRLRLEPYELDVDAARRWADSDTTAALGLWRGPALAEFRTLPALEVASVGLDELRLRLVDDLLEERITGGLPGDSIDRGVVADAATASAQSPLRERTALLHIGALAADGRAAEAMAAAQSFRRRLAQQSGLDPSPALAELEQRVAAGAVGRRPSVLSRAMRVTRPDGPMVGRQHDREEVLRLMANHVVVTLTGPGGVGKTRLALDIASGWDESTEVAVIRLAVVDRAEHVCQAVAAGLGLRSTSGVGPAGIAAALVDRSLLLVLDNCEHVVDACRELVAAVRRSAPGVRMLATSRVTLRAPDEYVVRLRPLPVPREAGDPAVLRRQPGVRAFVEHARRLRPDYDLPPDDAAHLVEVLRRLDGLPLGIELAARQVAVMPLRAVRERLDQALDLPTGRAGPDDERQRTLRVTIGSSYHLLNADEQRLLRLLAPFLGGVDLAAVETLAVGSSTHPIEALHRLVDSSLLVADPVNGRYHLLFTVRDFLLAELDRLGEAEQARHRFVARCRVVAEEIGTRMAGPDEAATDRQLRAELDNLRSARELADLDDRVAITVAVSPVVTWRDLREIWQWAGELAEDAALAGHPQRPAILAGAAEAARLVGDFDTARRRADLVIEAADPGPDSYPLLRAWGVRGVIDHFLGDFAGARSGWLRAAASPSAEWSSYVGSAALAAAYEGDEATARDLLDRARSGARCGSDRAFAAYVEGELLATTHPAEAVPHYQDAIVQAAQVGCTFVEGVARVSLASTRTRLGQLAEAAEDFAYLISSWRRTGQTTQLWTTARNAAELLATSGRPRTAALLLLCADDQPGAAAVDEEIARFSRRSYTPLAGLVDAATLAELAEEAGRLGAAEVLDVALAELGELAARPTRAGA